MITLTAKINLLSANNGDLSLNSSQNISLNNVSGELTNVVGEKLTYDSPFLLGCSNLGKGEKFVAENLKKTYFISKQLSDDNGNFSSQPSILLNDKNSSYNNLTIAFDTVNNRHPNKITVDGIEYFDDDAIFTVANLPKKSVHTIVINDWNTPNAPIVITGIYVNLEINIDNKNIISISGSLFDRSDLKLPSFGIISNKGEIEFNDISGEIRDYAEQGFLNSGLTCEIKLKNTLVDGAEETTSIFKTDEWSYDNDKKKVSISVKDDIEKLQYINVSEIYYKRQELEKKPLSWWYDFLYSKTKLNGFNMLSFKELDEKTKSVLNAIIIDSPYINASSLWSAWVKICVASLSRMYKQNDIIIFRHTGG